MTDDPNDAKILLTLAVQRFVTFETRFLRSLSGRGDAWQTFDAFRDLLESINDGVETWTLIIRVLEEMHDISVGADDLGEIEEEYMGVAAIALRLVAETLCSDPGANGRRSRRRQEMREQIEHLMMMREARALKNGRSVIADITKLARSYNDAAERREKAEAGVKPKRPKA